MEQANTPPFTELVFSEIIYTMSRKKGQFMIFFIPMYLAKYSLDLLLEIPELTYYRWTG